MNKKANRITIIFIAFLCLCSLACQNGASEVNNYNFTQVSSVIVLNATTEDKKADENKITISSSPSYRPAESPTFNPVYIESTGSRDAVPDNNPPEIRTFTVGGAPRFFNIHFQNSYSSTEKFKCVYASKHAYVWLRVSEENTSKYMTEEEYTNFANKFDVIYEQEIALCGPKYNGVIHPEINNKEAITNPNDKISLVFYDIDDDGAGNYGGFSSTADMFNGIECIHIDSCFAKNPQYTGYSLSTLAHEFNHKLNYDNKYFKYNLKLDQWYTEMLSMLVEDFFYEDIGIDRLSSSQGRLGTFVKNHNIGFKNWGDKADEGAKYANAYAFGAYLARNYGGAELIHEICTNEFTNEESVVNAVNKINNTNYTFKDLLKNFPYILINNDNNLEGYPSLNHSWKGSLKELPGYEYKLSNIDYKEINKTLDPRQQIEITGNKINRAGFDRIGGYGFLLYMYNKPTNVSFSAKNDLIVTAM